jgi:hypothetical protein
MPPKAFGVCSDFSSPTDTWVSTQDLLQLQQSPVLSRQAERGFEPQRGVLHKLPFKRFLFPIPEIEEVIPMRLNQILAFRLRTDDPYGARNL